MVVVTLTDCPPKVRGDLTKWLIEINTGVYVGNVNARVREKLWQRICENVKNGRATMVFSAAGEQHLGFWVHNTTWQPVDYDGIRLVKHPLSNGAVKENPAKQGFSAAAKRQKGRYYQKKLLQKSPDRSYCVVDLETTGLSVTEDSVIELAALRVRQGVCKNEFSVLIQCEKHLPASIVALTGITQEMLNQEGIPCEQALSEFLNFVGTDRLVSHNASFDCQFLQSLCQKCQKPMLSNEWTDTLSLARRKIDDIENYHLETLANYFSLEIEQTHRALEDCYLAQEIYEKLNEIQDSS